VVTVAFETSRPSAARTKDVCSTTRVNTRMQNNWSSAMPRIVSCLETINLPHLRFFGKRSHLESLPMKRRAERRTLEWESDMNVLTPRNIIAAAGAALLTAATVTGSARSCTAQAVQASRAGVGASARPTATLSIEAPPSPAPSIARGRYLVRIGGCNDCHTPGYGELGGRMPEAQWLTGSHVGFRGPWGISYPSNLRLTVQHIDEEQWVAFARARRLPPMPWFSLDAMSGNDLRSIYRFIHFLGPKGATAPTALRPGQQSATPFIPFVPQTVRDPA
jgi:hypothetical protein